MARVASALGALLLSGLPGGASSQQANASVVLRWKEVPQAETYQIEIAEDPGFQATVLSDRVSGAGYRWAEIPASRYFWRVRAMDSLGRFGSWSEVRTIEPALIPPELLLPADGARLSAEGASRTVELVCSGSRVVKRYAVEVASDPEFQSLVASSAGPSPRLRVNLRPGSFYWRMRATSLTGRETPPSRARRFSVVLRKAEAASTEPSIAEPPAPREPALPPAGADRGLPLDPAAAPVVPGTGSEGPGLPEPSRNGRALRAGVQVGWFRNLRRTASPWVSLEAAWRPGLLSGSLFISARLGTYTAHVALPPAAPAQPPEVSARVSPVSILGLYEVSLGAATLHGGLGACVTVVQVSSGAETATYVAAGGEAVVGAGVGLGPGDLFAESALLLGSIDRPLARLRTGGLLLSIGYRLGL